MFYRTGDYIDSHIPRETNKPMYVTKLNASTGVAEWVLHQETVFDSKPNQFIRNGHIAIGPRGDIYAVHSSNETGGWAPSNVSNAKSGVHTKIIALTPSDGGVNWSYETMYTPTVVDAFYPTVTGKTGPYDLAATVGFYMNEDGKLFWSVFSSLNSYGPFITVLELDVNGAGLANIQNVFDLLAADSINKATFLVDTQAALVERGTHLPFTPGASLTKLITNPPDTLTENTVFVSPKKVSAKKYEITTDLISDITTNTGVLYIPEATGTTGITLTVDSTDVTIDLGTDSLVFDGVTYGLGDSVPLTSSTTLNIIAFGSLVAEIEQQNEICVVYGTLIDTDQGRIPVQDVVPFKHTIRGTKVIAVTQTPCKSGTVVYIPPGSLGENVPSVGTSLSLNHRIYAKNSRNKTVSLTARELARNVPGVKRVKCTPENDSTTFYCPSTRICMSTTFAWKPFTQRIPLRRRICLPTLFKPVNSR